MKKLLISIVSSIIFLVVIISPVFCQDMVPKEDFDEVYNQLVISNDMLTEVTNDLENLTSSFDIYKAEYEKKLSDKDAEIELLKENLNKTKSEKEEILSQLIISNDMNIEQKNQISGLVKDLKEARERLEESNLLLEKPKDFSLGAYATSSNFDIGFGVDFSYFIFKGLTLDIGFGYAPPLTFMPKVGLSYLW
jgi:peptidoglycan hydrolase CwlO-like protein